MTTPSSIKEFREKFYEEEPSNDDSVIKLRFGNGPFAYRHAMLADLESFILKVEKQAYRKGKKAGQLKADKEFTEGINVAYHSNLQKL